MSTQSDRREVVYRMSSWSWILPVVFLVVGGIFITELAGHAWSLWTMRASADSVTNVRGCGRAFGIYLLALGLQLSILAYVAGIVIRQALEIRRGSLVLDTQGLVITNWRGKERQIPWEAISEIRVLLPRQIRNPPVTILADDESVAIPRFVIPDRQVVIAEILARSGLKKVSETWYSARYQCCQ